MGPSGADRTQVGPMLAPWTLLSWYCSRSSSIQWLCCFVHIGCKFIYDIWTIRIIYIFHKRLRRSLFVPFQKHYSSLHFGIWETDFPWQLACMHGIVKRDFFSALHIFRGFSLYSSTLQMILQSIYYYIVPYSKSVLLSHCKMNIFPFVCKF